ncbi:MAG: PspC domain-containing protein [Bacteroidales bacterium]|nr:PspC domain-containing protein [Bacteroidales bacterium]
MENKKFERSSTNRVIGGVCAGLADYLNLDIALMRVLFVVAAFCGSFGFWLYIILWIVIPSQKVLNFNNNMQQEETTIDITPDEKRGSNKGAISVSIILIVIGLIALMDNFLYIDWIWKLWPVILIVLGVVIIINTQKNRNNG